MAHGAGAQIRTDSSLGLPAQTLLGPGYVIPQAIGKLAGSNLFHSFEAFNINSGQSANFTTTTPGLANVVSRVTGGTASQINGQLKLTPVSGAPNFFFINPAGVAFGAGASVDVPGAFHVSTANYVKFGDGNFHADLGQTSTFSSAAPQAFGFLGATRASITVTEGATLSLAGSQAVGMAAGDIEINNATVSTVAGELRVLALGLNTQELAFSGALPAGAGDLSIKNGGQVSSATSSSVNAGNVKVSAGNITIDRVGNTRRTGIASQADAGSGNAGSVEVAASGALSIVGGGTISADTVSSGNGGAVKVTGETISADGRGSSYVTGITSEASSDGNAGSVDIASTSGFSVLNGAIVSGSGGGAGAGGSIKVRAANILLDGQGFSRSLTGVFGNSGSGSGNAGGIDISTPGGLTMHNGFVLALNWGSGSTAGIKVTAGSILMDGRDGFGAAIQANACLCPQAGSGHPATGNGGDVEVTVTDKLAILDTARIASESFDSKGKGGLIKVHAGSIVIDGGTSYRIASTGILSRSGAADAGGIGDAGSIEVGATDSIVMLNAGRITSDSNASAKAGSVKVTAGNILIDGAGLYPNFITGIASRARQFGGKSDAGSVEVHAAGSISVLNGGFISTDSRAGAAGAVRVSGGNIVIDGQGNGFAGIVSRAQSASTGNPGNVDVGASEGITLSHGGRLSIENDATVANPAALVPTTLRVSAPDITLRDASITAASTGNVAASDIQVNFTNRLSLDPSSISTSANLGNGGAISIFGGKIITLENSQITTSVSGLAGNGGNILVNADALVLNTGFIQANTGAPSAAGGLVRLNLQTLVTSGNSLLVGGNVPNVFQPGVFGYNVVQAAAPTGLSGVVQITTPLLDVSGSLSGLSTQVLDTGGLGRSPCQVTRGSTLAQSGRGGLAPSARGLLDVEPQFAQMQAVQSPLPEIHARAARASAGCL